MNMISVPYHNTDTNVIHTVHLALRNDPRSPLPSVEGIILCLIICIYQRILSNLIILVKEIVENTCVNLFGVPQWFKVCLFNKVQSGIKFLYRLSNLYSWVREIVDNFSHFSFCELLNKK